MKTIDRSTFRFKAYHAHVYFDEKTVDQANQLCEEIGQKFDVAVGHMLKKPVGPHPRWSCQIAFKDAIFDELVTWIDDHRKDLTVLLHGISGDELEDHTKHVHWLGKEETLNLAVFTR